MGILAAAGGVKTVGGEIEDRHDAWLVEHKRCAGRTCPGVNHGREYGERVSFGAEVF